MRETVIVDKDGYILLISAEENRDGIILPHPVENLEVSD